MANLTGGQKWHICDVARKAYDAWPGKADYERAAGEGINAFTEWRHDQQEIAVGVRSLRNCDGDYYNTLLGHFHRLRMKHLSEANNHELSLSP